MLEVTATNADGTHELGTKLSHCRLTTQFILSLLSGVRMLSTRQSALMARVATDTCRDDRNASGRTSVWTGLTRRRSGAARDGFCTGDTGIVGEGAGVFETYP